MTIKAMTVGDAARCAELFRDVFHGEPWRENWTIDTARKRLSQFADTKQFLGYVLEEKGRVIGLICGQREEYWDGPRFYIQEFCVAQAYQGQGVGKRLLDHLTGQLEREGITYLYLMTQRGERTEGFYHRRGFQTDEDLVWMHKKG